jgi:hypothetical protein
MQRESLSNIKYKEGILDKDLSVKRKMPVEVKVREYLSVLGIEADS